jgi:hypothetical protein
VKGLRNWLAGLGAERPPEQPPAAAEEAPTPPTPEGPVVTSKTLQRFLALLASRPAPVLLDLGPFSGANVTYFGQLLGCKVIIGDVFGDIDRLVRDGRAGEIAAFLASRFRIADGSVDGVLAWDVFDYLDRPAAHALAAILVRALRDDGVLLGFFGGANQVCIGSTRFVVEDESHVRLRAYESGLTRHGWMQNRDILKMFDSLRVTDSYLLQNGWREMLLRKGVAGRPVI